MNEMKRQMEKLKKTEVTSPSEMSSKDMLANALSENNSLKKQITQLKKIQNSSTDLKNKEQELQNAKSTNSALKNANDAFKTAN